MPAVSRETRARLRRFPVNPGSGVAEGLPKTGQRVDVGAQTPGEARCDKRGSRLQFARAVSAVNPTVPRREGDLDRSRSEPAAGFKTRPEVQDDPGESCHRTVSASRIRSAYSSVSSPLPHRSIIRGLTTFRMNAAMRANTIAALKSLKTTLNILFSNIY